MLTPPAEMIAPYMGVGQLGQGCRTDQRAGASVRKDATQTGEMGGVVHQHQWGTVGAPGLSLCAKTRQTTPAHFPTLEDCTVAAKKLGGTRWDGREGKIPAIQISPGLIRLSAQNFTRREKSQERAIRAQKTRVDLQKCGITSTTSTSTSTTDRRILEWSRKSRNRMIATMSELDWGAFLAQPGRLAMVTLTYPGDWRAVVSDGSHAYAHLNRLRLQYERDWGHELSCVWKREFQKRGAPHFHLIMVVPEGKAFVQVDGQKTEAHFATWLAWTWAKIVDADRQNGEFLRHLQRGTGVHYTRSRIESARHASFYFSKYAAKSADIAKEIQNRAPDCWVDEGKKIGRFWGVMGMTKIFAIALISPAELLFFGRTLARWAHANFGSRRMRGAMRTGFILVPDGARMAEALCRAAEAACGSAPPVGMRGTLSGLRVGLSPVPLSQ